MSSEKHPNLQLHKWAPTDYVKREEWNENFGIIDDKIGILSSQLADTTSSQGRPSGHSVWTEFEQRMINVKWFGAKGDGVTDDTTAIQNAAQAARGGYLFFPEGTYVISQPIQMSDITSTDKYRPVTKLCGVGIGKSIIINNVTGSDRACFEWNQSVDQAQNYRFGLGAFIEDIEIKGGVACTSNGIKAEGLFFFTILRSRIHQNGANGIYMPYNPDLEFGSGNGAGDDAYLTGYVHINQSFIQNNGKADKVGCGIYADKLSATFTIENSHITDNYGWGARLSTRELIINRTAFSNNGQGDGVTRYGGLRIQRASSIISGTLPHSNRFGQNEFDGNWGVDIDLYECSFSDIEGVMIIPRPIDKNAIPNSFRAPIGIKIGGGGSGEGVYNDIKKPVFRITDFNNGGDSNNDPAYTCVHIEAGNYGNRIIEPLFYSGGSTKVTKITDNGFNNEWVEGGIIRHKSGIHNVKPYVIARQPNPTSIPHNTITKLTWTSKQSDRYGMFDAANGTLTMPFGGVVTVKGFITLLNTVADKDISLYVYYNGAAYKRIFFRTIGGTYETIQFDFGALELPTAGIIDVRIYQSSGSSISLDSSNNQWSNLEIKID
jgi:Pectate lyase superfamily protein